MITAGRRITVFGGSGFIGRYVVKRLAAEGWVVRVAVRDPAAATFLKTMGNVGQVVPMKADLTDSDAVLRAAVAGSDAVVNLVGILYERGRSTFRAIHAEGPARLARISVGAGATQFVQISAIGADAHAESAYARSKAEGEAGVRASFPGAVILRPSIVFGPEDRFFNRFACMARYFPALPLIGGTTRFQPVYVCDVAEAVVRVLHDPGTHGKTFELGGPRTYTFRALMELMLAVVGRKRLLIDLPFWAADLQAAILEWLPIPPLTRDQVKLLKRDNTVAANALGFAALGIAPTAVEPIVPTYLDIFRKGGRFTAQPAA